MIAFGANCNFGDQLHPNGSLDLSTYENIGYAFDYQIRLRTMVLEVSLFLKLGYGDLLINLVMKEFLKYC